tara:strand:- start:3466 stop:4371 length:906 start_codon:yes stop_codon:yes gene_type:complete
MVKTIMNQKIYNLTLFNLVMIQDTSELKEKIVLVFKKRGPSLPVHVAKETGLSILFASAFLSELLSERKIKMSDMRVGSSPIYFTPGQEIMLEKFSEYLKSKEKEAFIFLRERKFLKDSEQEPAIRVALRAIKDFAIPFRKDEEIYWRYFIIPETEFKSQKKEASKVIKIKKPAIKIEKKESDLDIFKKPKDSSKKIKEKSEFVTKVLDFLKSKDLELLEEIESKKKEFLGIIKINTSLGDIKVLIIAKDKKKITKSDIELALQKNNTYKKIVLLVSTGEINKNVKEFLDKYKDIVRFLNI